MRRGCDADRRDATLGRRSDSPAKARRPSRRAGDQSDRSDWSDQSDSARGGRPAHDECCWTSSFMRSKTAAGAEALSSLTFKRSAFRGHIRAQSAIPNKLVEKTRGKSTKKWRKMALNGAFSRGKGAIFPCSEPIAPDCNTRVSNPLRSRSPAAASGVWSAKSTVRRHFSRSGTRNDYV